MIDTITTNRTILAQDIAFDFAIAGPGDPGIGPSKLELDALQLLQNDRKVPGYIQDFEKNRKYEGEKGKNYKNKDVIEFSNRLRTIHGDDILDILDAAIQHGRIQPFKDVGRSGTGFKLVM